MLRAHPIEHFASADAFQFPSGAVLFHGTLEERSVLPPTWTSSELGLERHEIFETDTLASFRTGSARGGEITLRRKSTLTSFLEQFRGRPLFIDITGLSHHIWMPIVRMAIENEYPLRCIYNEPAAYQAIPNPRPSEFFDLSSRIRGIAPIPTFSRLSNPSGKPPVLVPLLGFEGTRFKYLVEILQPEGQDIIPVVGVPGFKLDFPFHSYRGNGEALSSNRAWENVHFSDAACPFSLFETLEHIQTSRASHFLQISPIGTKPHALGAALFSLVNTETELVYDHPIRKKQRSNGVGRCHVFYINEFLQARSSRQTR